MEATTVVTKPEISYADLGRALLWVVEVDEVAYLGVNTSVVTLKHPHAPVVIQIDPLGATRFEKEEPTESVDASDHQAIAMWIAAGFHLSLSLATLKNAQEQVASEVLG
ncbi:hypothetical protein [Mycolicibacterium helvum]|uniref:Uncharacterized protein n=1 Tax=Mycolicibacterium helvum TaxID=1534349 RepID=A0A7I7SYT6_9MYCO|nr:hypothetical protein [Mycolicibacterium helvum]BBY62194.1 hypothetical protein MHEL_04370 [Mycolicibacterium helvum]